jgi:hydroxypyruvate reductase
MRRAVRLNGELLSINETSFDLTSRRSIYAVAIGKAAHAMAAPLDELLGHRLTAGVLAGLSQDEPRAESLLAAPAASRLSKRWRVFAGGHPLPNEESLAAARAAFDLLSRAEAERALVIFLISGGGSATLEWPRDESVTLEELREANRLLVHCGASIEEINAVRRALSAVKGGRLAQCAPRAEQLTLIISDTNTGEEANVASGPTLAPPLNAPDAADVISRYELEKRLPASILRAVGQPSPVHGEQPPTALRKDYVLLDNEDAISAASDAARAQGFVVEVANDIVEQEISAGCAQLLERLVAARRRAANTTRGVCLLSGGEFACPVRGAGLGGRNSETALRLALEVARQERRGMDSLSRFVALSAGTDGIDGNSPAAGALSDETTLRRAESKGLDAQGFLQASDAYAFFNALGDVVVTGATQTNVRDVRVLLAT